MALRRRTAVLTGATTLLLSLGVALPAVADALDRAPSDTSRRVVGAGLPVRAVLAGRPLAAAGLVADDPTPDPGPDACGEVADGDPDVPVSTTADGWPRYQLKAGQQPAAHVPQGSAFRAEYVFLTPDCQQRSFRIYVPPGLTGPAPRVTVLHGLSQGYPTVIKYTGFTSTAAQYHSVIVYGGGLGGSWDAGSCCGHASADGVDDMAYLDEVAGYAGHVYPVDVRRRYLTGFSNGAMMAYRYACERPQDVTAVAGVAATIVTPCHPSQPVAVLHVHGGKDQTVPYKGTAYSQQLKSRLPPVAAALKPWHDIDAGSVSFIIKLLPKTAHSWPTASADGYDTSGQISGFFSHRIK